MPLTPALKDKIQGIVRSNEVVLFMKGTRRTPQCGFSAAIVQILDELIPNYQTVDVLQDPDLRDGIKEFSEWPTIPQLYIKQEFVGGCDIVQQMHASGELMKLLGIDLGEVEPPKIHVTDAAAKALKNAAESKDDFVHVEVSPRYEYSLFVDPKNSKDIQVEANGIPLLLDEASARRADGLTIDFIEGPSGAGFKIESPHQPSTVKQLSAAELKAMIDSGQPFELFDVRTDKERAIAKIDRATHLNPEGQQFLEDLDKNTTLVFHCHHGMRSQAAAEHYLAQGFKKVYNLKGGIDAWSQTVDPSVPRY